MKSRPEISWHTLEESDPNLIFNLNFQMSSDVIYEERSIYTFWDLLGDVGGLFGSLTFLAGIYRSIVGTLLGSKMNQYITAQLFRLERKHAP